MPDMKVSNDSPASSENTESPVEKIETAFCSAPNDDRRVNEIRTPAEDVHWTTHATFWSQVVLGLIGIAALYIYHGQLGVMQQQLELMAKQLPELQKSTKAAQQSASAAQSAISQSRDQFRLEQRPYLAFGPSGAGQPTFTKNRFNPSVGQIVWTFHVSNFGKTPAYDVHVKRFLRIGDMSFVPSFAEEPVKDPGIVIPPEADNFSTIASQPIPIELYDRLLTVHDGIQMKIFITYRDSYGVNYETNYCMTRLNNGAISYCAASDIK